MSVSIVSNNVPGGTQTSVLLKPFIRSNFILTEDQWDDSKRILRYANGSSTYNAEHPLIAEYANYQRSISHPTLGRVNNMFASTATMYMSEGIEDSVAGLIKTVPLMVQMSIVSPRATTVVSQAYADMIFGAFWTIMAGGESSGVINYAGLKTMLAGGKPVGILG